MIAHLIGRILFPEYAGRDRGDDVRYPVYDIYESGGVELHETELSRRLQVAKSELQRQTEE